MRESYKEKMLKKFEKDRNVLKWMQWKRRKKRGNCRDAEQGNRRIQRKGERGKKLKWNEERKRKR